MDRLYSDYSEIYNKTVNKYKCFYQDNKLFDKEKCFWAPIDKNDKAYRILDRTSNCAKTYIKKGGTDKEYWAYTFDGINPPKME